MTTMVSPVDSCVDKLPERLSPSRLKDFQQCPRLFFYKTIEHRVPPNTIATVRGTLAHTALERLFDHPAEERTVETALSYVQAAWKVMTDPEGAADPCTPEGRIREARRLHNEEFSGEVDLDERDREKARDYLTLAPIGSDVEADLLAQAESVVEAYFQMEHPERFDPKARELHVQADAHGMTYHGFIDRLDTWTTSAGETRWSVTDYKGLALDTPLPTPTGWTTMGAVLVGDELLGADGLPVQVVAKSDVFHRPCYRVTFDDASSIVCDNVHLWKVVIGRKRNPIAQKRWPRHVKVVDTDELFRLRSVRKDPITIPNARPLVRPTVALPIDPYLLGYWLGDGTSKNGEITVHEGDLPSLGIQLDTLGERYTERADARMNGVSVVVPTTSREGLCSRGHKRSSTHDCRECAKEGRTGFPRYASLHRRLRALGLIGNKHVPTPYLRASEDQRLALLQGLMDTDGSWNKARQQAVFCNTNEALVLAVEEIVCSLGGRTSRFSTTYTSDKHGQRTATQVMFTPVGYNPFRLPRKADLVRLDAPERAKRRAILYVEPIESVPTQCVAVDSSDSLYLAGRQMVPTHNTGVSPQDKDYSEATIARITEEAFFAMKIYALLWYEQTGIVINQLRLVYLGSGNPEQGILRHAVDEELLADTRAMLGVLWMRITKAAETGRFNPKPGPLCKWCSFRPICPAFTYVEPPRSAPAVSKDWEPW